MKLFSLGHCYWKTISDFFPLENGFYFKSSVKKRLVSKLYDHKHQCY